MNKTEKEPIQLLLDLGITDYSQVSWHDYLRLLITAQNTKASARQVFKLPINKGLTNDFEEL